MKPNPKWAFAIGTTSRVPRRDGEFHYLIADFDTDRLPANAIAILHHVDNAIIQRTNHGWHLYTDKYFSFRGLCDTLNEIGADANWIEIGKERGYFFLADKSQIVFPWPVEHMVIYYDKGKTQNAKTS